MTCFNLLILNGRDLFVYCPGQQGNIQINPRDLYRYFPCIHNKEFIQFISPAFPCYIIKPSPDFQLVKYL